jgi:hypothetical protein
MDQVQWVKMNKELTIQDKVNYLNARIPLIDIDILNLQNAIGKGDLDTSSLSLAQDKINILILRKDIYQKELESLTA